MTHRAPVLGDVMPWTVPGIRAGRAWVYAPDPETLRRRWDRLLAAAEPPERARLFGETRTRTIADLVAPLPGGDAPDDASGPLRDTAGPAPRAVRVAHRPFDREWLLADARLLDAARPELWRARGARQVFVTTVPRDPDGTGPVLLASAHVPDDARHGGRAGLVAPLYRDPEGTGTNVAPGLAAHLAARLALPVADEDVVAWAMACAVRENGAVHVPLTVDQALWRRGVALGRRSVWLHTYGARFSDDAQGRPAGRPRLPGGRRPFVRQPVTGRPDAIAYDPDDAALLIGGDGRISPVPQAVWDHAVAGAPVLRAWFAARQRSPEAAGLDAVAPRWTADTTAALVDLLHVLGLVAEADAEARTLRDEVAAAGQVDAAELVSVGVLPPPAASRRPVTVLHPTDQGPGGQAVLL